MSFMMRLDSHTLEEFVILRLKQEASNQLPSGRLFANCKNEENKVVWKYVELAQSEFLTLMSYDEQFIFACFILLAEGREIPELSETDIKEIKDERIKSQYPF